MSKRLIALGFIMLIAGSFLLGLGLYFQKKEKQILDSIKLRLDKLEQVNTDEVSIKALADIFTSDDWKQQLQAYNQKRESRELLVNTSAVFVFAAGTILTAWLIMWLVGVFWHLIHKKQTANSEQKQSQQVVIIEPENKQTDAEKDLTVQSETSRSEHIKIFEKAGWQNFNTAYDDKSPQKSKTQTSQPLKSFADALNSAPQSLELLFSDERASELKKRFKLRSEKHSVQQKASHFRQDQESARLEKIIDAQKEQMDEQVTEFKEMAETVKKAAERSEPIGTFLKDLTLQVSAIRDYALTQQDRIKKLQDGYDWNIIRTFGLKVIRCIDNLDDRIERFKQNGQDIEDLVEIRDELIFSLESSGIEQYEPEINSDYSGQEKIAEAVRDREDSENQDMKGKIAAVLKPGYRHFIDEENFKVVRAARVKLYG